jgi:hypothetical protein
MFNHGELDTVRKFGGNMHRDHLESQDDKSNAVQRPRLLIQDQSTFDVDSAEKPPPKPEGRLAGPYKHVRYNHPVPWMQLTNLTSVSSCPPCSFPSHPLLFPVTARPWHPAVALPRPNWRLQSRTRVCS